MSPDASAMTFPCSFPLKVMGHNIDAFEAAVRAILNGHLRDESIVFARKSSSGGKYLSITATFTATSREQLDAIYRELNAHELVMLTL
jgi:putative lipoic acid-binding regulatory protein